MLELDPTPEEIDAIGAAAMTLMLFLVPIVAQRREAPGDDLLSALVHPPDGGAALETDEIITMCLLLLAAGHETTANLIGNGTLALLQHPDQLDWLAQHPDLTPQAVDELLRYDSPAQVASRIARNNLVLGGVRVRKGQQALVVLGAANRDPARYPDPDRLDLTRTGTPHLAFGNGPHFCVGAGLARLEAQETFNRLAQSTLRPRADSWSLLPGAIPHLPAAAKPAHRRQPASLSRGARSTPYRSRSELGGTSARMSIFAGGAQRMCWPVWSGVRLLHRTSTAGATRARIDVGGRSAALLSQHCRSRGDARRSDDPRCPVRWRGRTTRPASRAASVLDWCGRRA